MNNKERDKLENRIEAMARALEQGREQFRGIMEEGNRPAFAVDEVYDFRGGESVDEEELAALPGGCDRIAAGDNLDYMVWLLREKKMAGKIQLIYVDPPFFTNARYQASVQIQGRDGKKSPVLKVGAYRDTWGGDLSAYLQMLSVRFYLMRELLSETGCLWVHLDWHGSHYVKTMLDEIFGEDLFVNEVAWTYKSGGASKRSFARKHDTLLFYGKTAAYKFHPLKEKSYNREFKPYHFKGVKEYQDKIGWYTMVNMKDVWNIDMVGRTSAERRGYATQKPEKLLERIVDACTDPGDLCADFFAGTGTLGAVCARRGRPWILCDEGDVAIASQIARMGEIAWKQTESRHPDQIPGPDAGKEPSGGGGKEPEQKLGDKGEPAGTGGRPFLVERPVRPYEIRPRTTIQPIRQGARLRIGRCQPDLTQIREQDRQIVADHINADVLENSLDLISFWSLDPDRSGGIHCCRKMLEGREDQALSEPQGLSGPQVISGSGTAAEPQSRRGDEPSATRRPHIVGYDIFGNRFEWTEGE